MNTITLLSRTDKPLIFLPPFDGLASFQLLYNHNLKKPVKNVLKVILTIDLLINEQFMGDKQFKIMSIVNNYRVNIKDKLEVKDLTKIWFESAKYTVDAFNAFERAKFGKANEIAYSDEDGLIVKVKGLVDWYNALP